MSIGLIGKKIGMTREFFESGISVPVTVLFVVEKYVIGYSDCNVLINDDPEKSPIVSSGTNLLSALSGLFILLVINFTCFWRISMFKTIVNCC